jgi:1-acyl-sn-glycerol-3-phosphate acyltransferase
MRAMFGLAVDLHIDGLSNVPRTGPLIIAINHSSFIDPLLVGSFIPRDVVMMSKIENFSLPLWGPIVKWYGAFPIHRGEADREAIKKALEVLRDGGVLLMAPEGTRSLDGQLQAGHDGLALIAARTHAPVVPFVIAGAKPVSRNVRKLKRTTVRVRIGPPLEFAGANPRASREELARFTEQIMLQMAALLPPEQRGVYRERLAEQSAPAG